MPQVVGHFNNFEADGQYLHHYNNTKMDASSIESAQNFPSKMSKGYYCIHVDVQQACIRYPYVQVFVGFDRNIPLYWPGQIPPATPYRLCFREAKVKDSAPRTS